MRLLGMRVFILSSLAALYLSWITPAVDGHHAGLAQYDRAKRFSMVGKVVRIYWGNPHVLVYLEVKDIAGAVQLWTMDPDAPPHVLQNFGWHKDTLKVGDQISVTGYRSKNGSYQGFLAEVLFDGRNLLRIPSFSIVGKVTRINWAVTGPVRPDVTTADRGEAGLVISWVATGAATVSLELDVKDEKGVVTPWVIETGSRDKDLEAAGWRADTLKAGDEIAVQGELIGGSNGKGKAAEIRFLGKTLFSTPRPPTPPRSP